MNSIKEMSNAANFSVRIVIADHYSAPPVSGLDVSLSEFRGSEVKQVPIVRIFGSTPGGEKVCLHVHGVFPYLYIPCEEIDPEPRLYYQIASSIDKAINISMKQTHSNTQHVYKVTLVKGLPFYGYHRRDHQFLKIFFYNPYLIKRASDLLQNGAIMGLAYQPHEIHINYIMQFFIDFNLYGMSFINLSNVKFRTTSTDSKQSIPCVSSCELEADCLAQDILNRFEVVNGQSAVNPGIEALWKDERLRHKDLGLSGNVGLTQSQLRENLPYTESHEHHSKKLLIKLALNSELNNDDTLNLTMIESIDQSSLNLSVINKTVYPAEVPEEQDCPDATTVVFHTSDKTTTTQCDEEVEYLVDEDIVAKCSQQSGSLGLDNDDLHLMEMLQDLEHNIENDSILCTQNKDMNNSDYQEINEDPTLREDKSDDELDWHDSYWEGIENMSQLDGTWDDKDDSQKPKTRLRLGLSRKCKRKLSTNENSQSDDKKSKLENVDDKFKATFSPRKATPKKPLRNFTPLSVSITKSPTMSQTTPRKSTTQSSNDLTPKRTVKNRRKSNVNLNRLRFSPSESGLDNIVEISSDSDRDDNKLISVPSTSKVVEVVESSSDDDNGIVSFYNMTNLPNMSYDELNSTKLTQNSSGNDVKLFYQSESDLNEDCIESDAINRKVLIPLKQPPSRYDVESTMIDYDIESHRNDVPYYSNHGDVGAQIEIGQIVLKLKSKHHDQLKEFPSIVENGLNQWQQTLFNENSRTQVTVDKNALDLLLSGNRRVVLAPVIKPPKSEAVAKWLTSYKSKKSNLGVEVAHNVEKLEIFVPSSPGMNCSQMDTMSLTPCSLTPEIQTQTSEESDIACAQVFRSESPIVSPEIFQNDSDATYRSVNVTKMPSCEYKFSGDNYQNAVHHEHEHLVTFALEILTITRGELNPDPEHDSIQAIFYSILNDCPDDYKLPTKENGIIAVDKDFNNSNKWLKFYPEISVENFNFTTVEDELKLFNELVELIDKWNPDILCGFEIEMSSWGYLFQRGFALELNIPSNISRIKANDKFKYKSSPNNPDRDVKVIGRIMLDVWRLLRHEIALTTYSFENIAFHVLHERLPQYSHKSLTFWWNHPSKLLRSLTMEYYLTRVINLIRIMQQLDLIGRTSELARLFGIQWYEVLSRGSQFRVESMMIRLSRPLNYVLVSPSVQQRALMKAPECIPLILEPESRFYGDPVIVLDFQSLYPSMMIAYNYCYSTCIGKVENMRRNDPFQFGATRLKVSHGLLKKFSDRDRINWSPNGVGFVKPDIRKGILPRMLEDILNTRFMVKKSMKRHKSNKTLQKILHNRQLGLKLIANVTYGYTSANFSGRMPCVEVGDSVVSKGRETLERAINLVETTPKWRAKVVYGDTDSLFVLVPGRTRQEAFDIGAEIAEAVTNANPSPVKLKLEKVYQPCILQTKKRYVGFMYENKDQVTPEYEAKGIETVRRDGCPAVSKMLEKTLRILFETYDMSKVKSFICRKFQNIIEGKCNIQDFIFAKEFRGINGYKEHACVPALEIAKKLKAADHRKEPREGERVPYVVVNGAPGEILIQTVRRPSELIADTSLRINHNYYITKVIIPPLNRCLTLIGADVNKWFDEMPRRQVQSYPILHVDKNQPENKKSTISQYFAKINCAGCDCPTIQGLCQPCIDKPQPTYLTLQNKINEWQRNFNSITKICSSCCGRSRYLECGSIDCPVMYSLNASRQNLEQIPFIEKMKESLDF